MRRLQKFSSFNNFILFYVLFSGAVLTAGPEKEEADSNPQPPSPLRIFKVVIDPGHGGVDLKPKEDHGDKYDPISDKYLELYKSGASSKGRKERAVVLELAKEVKEILDLTKTPEGFETFKSYMKSFTNDDLPWIKIDSVMTRNGNAEEKEYSANEDPNAPYRLFDYPDKKTKKIKQGRISFINSEKPNLVLSLHLNPSYKEHPGGMAAVLSPSYRTFYVLKGISEGRYNEDKFNDSPWAEWMIFKEGWSKLENAVADAWIYFHGYWPNKSGKKTDLSAFEGYRQNMISWRYKDIPGWEELAKAGGKGPYSKSHKNFVAEGKFWEREKAEPELWRREDGREGFGGDNHYASAELMRFVQYGLRKRKTDEDSPEPGPINKPYLSTYALPTFINAISAYLEIGYIDKEKDMILMTKRKKDVAISLAAGIYSLAHGIKIKQQDYPYVPVGKKINWKRYENLKDGKNYFQIVSD
ncbi:N-acetylmuramoyl-L-alanine amidase [Leptospira kmetyi]|uniref:N-acetylmuramoyl-L-alanine amidase n=1 Tax=Leptospira kmetyi TaxID=408139 RepID=A0A5F1XVH2_9LEPT|nr:N-acetylmuramoyl-L-alanine amidase [Leptospira kmetyi]AYV55062.1 N-acetylmuramoyl-L-alanine amidase [Leptospira kmetyi]EQA51912.1 N-acetylmuramoyl-L-alanine amidase domain protein [Leptospira kmetyi serovar Malaysia str. Bejo-Iso9]TGK19526.1 N-acetylmuramoyl-L-alanine amidase [Leptospira kmetyi]TGK26467.1 N-acetylmuramoyl-L-alanine amidase [Leptospira kmetyi]TGL70263.1 N-acetylmuramoyl-L-alanine amidase [Leptospira kmetyi]